MYLVNDVTHFHGFYYIYARVWKKLVTRVTRVTYRLSSPFPLVIRCLNTTPHLAFRQPETIETIVSYIDVMGVRVIRARIR